jgi:hypothetical protein
VNRGVAVAVLASLLACGDGPAREERGASMKGTSSVQLPVGVAAEFPLQVWMKANASTALTSGDAPRLASAFHRIGDLGPPASTELRQSWREIAALGEAASHAKDIDRAREACKSCHDLHRATYKAQFRSRPLPANSRE